MSGVKEAVRFSENWSETVEQGRYSIEFELFLAGYLETGGAFEQSFADFSQPCRQIALAIVNGVSGHRQKAIDKYAEIADGGGPAGKFAQWHALIANGNLDITECKPVAREFRLSRDWEQYRNAISADIDQEINKIVSSTWRYNHGEEEESREDSESN